MKFQRNARIFRGQLDAAPFAAVCLLLVIFLMAGLLAYTPGRRPAGSLVYTPAVRLQLPVANDLPGWDQPSVSVAIDKNGQLYFENQWIGENELRRRLTAVAAVAQRSHQPLTLLVQADKEATYEMILRLRLLARDAGIPEAFLATLPRPFDESAPRSKP
jgi:biopolymer transport protein ExbD